MSMSMKGRAWRTRKLAKGITRQILKLNRDYELSIDFCHAETDPDCAAPLNAMAHLRFLPMNTDVCSKIVMNGSESWPVGERMIRSRWEGIHMARQWQAQVSKSIRKLRLPLKDIEA